MLATYWSERTRSRSTNRMVLGGAARAGGVCLAAATLALLGGCASMNSSKEDLEHVGKDEGIVIGSVFLHAAESEAHESGWAFLKGRKASDLDYSISISETGFNPFATTYSISAKPGEEVVFIKNLPAGSYYMNELQTSGIFSPQLGLHVGANFAVKAGQTTYIGKLQVDFPDRIGSGSAVNVEILDAQEETIDKLRADYPSIVPGAVKELATRSTMR
ncbi:MAG: hypothetical protein HOP15_15495 [Planctomycetes bacterium]|nr:hypothetical protein [Planctomycetota bacterium]